VPELDARGLLPRVQDERIKSERKKESEGLGGQGPFMYIVSGLAFTDPLRPLPVFTAGSRDTYSMGSTKSAELA
jgi:hypothetical protein